MDIVSLVVQIVSGVVGGNAAGMSKEGMGPLLNSILGGWVAWWLRRSSPI